MKNNNTAKRRASVPGRTRQRRQRRTTPFPLILLLVSVGLLGLVVSTATYNARRAAPPPVENPDHLVLNEVCCADQTQLTAPDGNLYSWVELYNPTQEPISLKGWSLSNRKTDLYRYRFSKNQKIGAGKRLLVYCTGSLSDASAFRKKKALHADFSVGRGESVCLSQNGVVVDLMELPGALHRDTSYGRSSDGSAELAILTPTPKKSNDGAEQHALVDLPEFSEPSGFYDGDFQLSITAPRGCTVYYTLDSTEPTAASSCYTEPLTIGDATSNPNVYSLNPEQSYFRATPLFEGQQTAFERYYCSYLLPTENMDKCTVVRAVAVDEAGNVSDVATASYFVDFDGRSAYEDIPVLSLVGDPEDLFGDKGIMVAGAEYKKKLSQGTITTGTSWADMRDFSNFFGKGAQWERPTHIDFFNEDKSLSFSQETGLRIHGNIRRKQLPKSFSLRARPRYDGNALLQQPLFGNQMLTDKVFLVSGGSIRTYALVNRMDNRETDTQDYRPIQLFLNGEYWGFYAIQECYNSGTFLEDHFGLDKDSTLLFKANGGKTIPIYGSLEETEEDYFSLLEYARSHDLSKEENWAQLNTMMDVQSFADFYAADLYLCNMDFNWRHNMYLFKSQKVNRRNPWADGRWHWLLYDVDYSTGDGSSTAADHNMFQGKFLNGKYSLDTDPLFPYLAKNGQFRRIFANTFLDIANDVYGADEMSALMEQFKDQWREASYASAVRYPVKDEANPPDPETKSSRFQSNCDGVAAFFRERFDHAVPDMANYFGLTGEQVTVTLQGSEGGTVTLNTLTPDLGEQDWQGIYYTDVPVVLRANPEPGMALDHWEVSSGTLSEDENGDTLLKLEGDTTVRAVFTVDDSPAEQEETIQ